MFPLLYGRHVDPPLDTGSPSSQCEELSLFFISLCERSAKRDVYLPPMATITGYGYPKHDLRLAAYRGAVLQRCEFKGLYGNNGNGHYS